jgi:pectate lyase
MKKTTTFFASLAMLCVTSQISFAQCTAMGWATYDGQSASSITGGGNATPVQVTTFAQLKAEAASSSPKVIYVMNDVGNGYKGETGDRVILASNKTIIGFKPGITVKAGWLIKGVSNVIVKNLICRGPGNSNSEQNWDCVNIENSKKVWFDHCTIMEGEDGNFDVVKGADNVTATWCKFTYVTGGGHNFSNLVGSSDNETQSHGKLNVTYAYCWWDNVADRTPRTRYGKIHVLNSYYNKSANPNAGFMANQRIEACYFEGGGALRTISTGGKVVHAAIGNFGLADRTISEGGYTIFTPPYTYKKYAASEVKALVTNANCGAGPTLDSPTDCGCNVVTSIEEEENIGQIAIYPNPSKSNFNVNLPSVANIQVFDADGRLCEEHNNVSKTEFGENLKPGLYFLKIDSKVYKLIKE